jgi:hypothetical protein
VETGGHGLLHAVVVHLLDARRLEAHGGVGVVDQDIQPAKFLGAARHRSSDGVQFEDVGGGEPSRPAQAGEFSRRFPAAGFIVFRHHHGGAFAGKTTGDTPADAGARAGYQGNPVL